MEVSRQVLFGKLNASLFRSIDSATAFCKLRTNPYVELAHWLHQLLQLRDSDLHRLMHHFQVDAAVVQRDLAKALDRLPAGASSIQDFSLHVTSSIESAWLYATLAFNDSKVRSGYLLIALLETPELARIVASISAEFKKFSTHGLLDTMPALIAGSPEEAQAAYTDSGLPQAQPGEAAGALAQDGPDGAGAAAKDVLARYCSDLTEQARRRQIDPVVGRGHEIRTMVDILLRRRQNNPLLVGEAGVGKTAVVEGFALAMADAEVPPSLRAARLLSLDVGALLAGASMKGEFEARLKAVLKQAVDSTVPVVLFVDEVHTLIGAGGNAGTGDAANLLKPALARGQLRVIGATTWSEYKRHIEKDPALTRRFQVLQVLEPDEAAAIDMVRGLSATFEQHHRVTVLDEAVRAAVTFSHRYIPARQLPDKAISLLDTACARVAMSLHAPPPRIEYLRQQRASAETELSLIRREALVGYDSRARLDALDARIHAVAAELATLEQRWQQVRATTQHLLALRQQLIEQGPDRRDELLAEAQRLASELATLQGDTPMVCAQVNEAVVASIVADWTGIPVGRMVRHEVDAVLNLGDELAERVIGQPHALARISERVRTARAGLTDPGKPVGVFLLVGPSGVGKTETALALAQALYGGEQNLITLNMSEYQEAHTVSSLKGSPPGYVGYGEGGVLTEAVRRRPYSVVLLDEIEKAHRDVHELFYQVFDKGWMEDGEGRLIDFRNTLLLLTSNTGADLISGLHADPALVPDASVLQEALVPQLRQVFPAAFLGRLTVVPYVPLADPSLAQIVDLHLQRVVGRMVEQHGIALDFTAAVAAHVISRCPTGETGARLLIGFIEQEILPRLSLLWLEAATAQCSIERITVDVDVHQLVYRVTPD